MAKYKVEDIHNLALVGHRASGKTSLADALLFKACVLPNAPLGDGAKFSDVVSVLNPPDQAPAGGAVDVAAARSRLVDAIVEADDALMEKYLTEGTVSGDELTAVLPKAMVAGT